MAVSAHVYTSAPSNAYGSTTAGNSPNIDWLSDTIKVMLCTSSYSPNQNTHAFKSDITNEVSGTGYTATGATLGSKTQTVASGVATFSGANTSWTSSTITARYAIVYDATPSTDATRPLCCYVDFGADAVSNNGTFLITWSGSGIFTITCS